jgi:hypothetical protein
MIVGIDPRAVLSIPAAEIGGRVFKTWPWYSDGIGDTLLDLARARPDLFPGVPLPLVRSRYLVPDGGEAGTGEMRNRYGREADAVLSRYRVERRGAPGNDGRVDVVIDVRNGALVYAGATYNYDPAKTNLQDAVTFVGGALAGYGLVTALGGAVAGASGAAAGGGAAGGVSAPGGSAWLDAALAADFAAADAAAAAAVGGVGAIEAAALAPLAIGQAASSGAAATLGSKLTGQVITTASKAGEKWLTSSLVGMLTGGAGGGGPGSRDAAAVAVDRSASPAWRPWALVLLLAAGAAALVA